jgi:hypothetical protein
MAEKDKVYKCLNPVGIQDSVELFPLAPRLDKIDGKTVGILANKSAEELNQDLVEKLRDSKTEVKIVLEIK